jgi:uncharacterized protein YlxW (UPF0749 family)
MSSTGTARRPDASLTLLQRIVDDSLDPTYAEVARRRAADPRAPRPRLRHALAVGGVLAVLGLLTATAVEQTWRALPDTERARTDLVDRVQQATAAVDGRDAQVRALAAEVDTLRATALGAQGEGARLAARLDALQGAAGATPLTGPGVQVVLDDGPPSREGGVGPDLARVLDRDLQLVVNGLFAAGAEAVEVNGQRVTAVTTIRAAGEAVLVGFRPLSRPYVMTAIGDPRTLEARFVDSAAGRELHTLAVAYGIRFESSTHDSLTVAGQTPSLTRWARPRGSSWSG